jgi:hypothetical protein
VRPRLRGRARSPPSTTPSRVQGGELKRSIPINVDFVELPDRAIGIALADVAGQGVTAALIKSNGSINPAAPDGNTADIGAIAIPPMKPPTNRLRWPMGSPVVPASACRLGSLHTCGS